MLVDAILSLIAWGFIKFTNHQPLIHRPNKPPTHQTKFIDLPTRYYFKDLIIKRHPFYRIQTQLGNIKPHFGLFETFSL